VIVTNQSAKIPHVLYNFRIMSIDPSWSTVEITKSIHSYHHNSSMMSEELIHHYLNLPPVHVKVQVKFQERPQRQI
jgi:hypothetical protein